MSHAEDIISSPNMLNNAMRLCVLVCKACTTEEGEPHLHVPQL
jgi:hypothetical protein